MTKPNQNLCASLNTYYENNENNETLLLLLASRVTPITKSARWLKRNSKRSYLSDAVFKGELLQFGLGDWAFFNTSHAAIARRSIVMAAIGLVSLAACCYFLHLAISDETITFRKWIDEMLSDGATRIKLLIGIVGVVFAAHWSNLRRKGERWEYCAEVFNEVVLKNIPEVALENDLKKRQRKQLGMLYQRSIMAFNLLDCNLWFHKSFWAEFNLTLESAIIYSHRSNQQDCCKKLEIFQLNKLKRKIARSIISEFTAVVETQMFEPSEGK